MKKTIEISLDVDAALEGAGFGVTVDCDGNYSTCHFPLLNLVKNLIEGYYVCGTEKFPDGEVPLALSQLGFHLRSASWRLDRMIKEASDESAS